MTIYYQKHLFFCTNQKEGDKRCCANANAVTLSQYAKQRCAEEGVNVRHQVRVSQSGRLGRCEKGPCLVIYPTGQWYTYRSFNDIDRIIEQAIVDNDVVTDLLLDPLPK